MCVCSVCCVFSTTLGRDLRGNGQISICLLHLQKKKKALLAIQIYALSTSLLPSLSLSPSSISPPLSKWHLQMTRASRVSGAKGGIGGAGGEKKKRGGREGRRKREQAPLTSHFPSTTPACQPACSLFSFELSVLPQHRKKINSYFHNPHSCLSTCLCLSPSLHPSPSLFLSPSLALPWGGLTPPPRSYGLQMSLR